MGYTFKASATGVAILAGFVSAWTFGSAVSSTYSGPVDQKRVAAVLPDGKREQLLNAYAKLPMAFVENHGQVDTRVRYYVEGPRYAFYLTRGEIVLSFLEKSDGPSRSRVGGDDGAGPRPVSAVTTGAMSAGLALSLRFVAANPNAVLEGAERAAGEVSYFRGTDPSHWQSAIPRYGEVVYRELWPGVDLRLREQAGVLKYEFRVRPGAQPAAIGLSYRGADGLAMDESGGLLVKTGMGVLRDSAPMAYQTIDGVRVPVESRYVLKQGAVGDGRYGFAVGAYQPDRELVIDPGVQYSTFLGGASHEIAAGIEVDAAGNAYVVGTTQSPDFPTTPGAFKRTGAAGNFSDVFVSKLNANGTALIYSTFIGGSDLDFGRRIAIDAAGNAYVTGQTKSTNFPTTGGAFDRTFNVLNCPRCGVDQYDTFVTKLNAAGSALVYSTFLGGTDFDDARGIAVDGAGNAYVTGETLSPDFPTTAAALQRTSRGAYDVFVTKLNAAGSALAYSTYLGGTQVDNAERVAVDAGGNAYVMGFTSSTDFPTTAGAFDTTANGGFDVFVAKLNSAGSGLVYSTYLGGQGFDSGGGLAVDAAGSAYVSGSAGSTDFPTTAGAFDTSSDGSDAFVAKLNPAGSALDYSTVIGGTGSEGANAIAVDPAGNAWLTGITGSVDYPVTANAADRTFNGTADAFVSELRADGAALLYSTYLGGGQSDSGNDLAIDPGGDVYVAGHTYSLDFPTTLGALDTIFNGDLSIFWGDAFVAKFATDTDTSTPPSTPATPGAPALVSPLNGDNPQQPVTFDWNDAPSAVSYTIQIDDSSSFTAPLVRDQSVTSSVFVASGLATTQQFWRVRGVNSAGVAGPWSAVRAFTPQAPPPPATLSTMSTNPSTVVGGNASSATVVLSVPAPEGGALITLSSSNPGVARVPATTTVPANTFTATFTIATSAVAASTPVTITAVYNGTTRTATLTVTPAATTPPAATLQSVTLTPASVTAGSASQGAVILSGGAPQGGATIALSSSNPGAAAVPASVTVASGASGAAFTVSTAAVSAAATVTISAVYNGATRTASLTVTPSAPPQTATLTVTASGRNGERVTSSPAGISVATGSSGSASFAPSTSITLTVSNGRDAIWSGACSSSGSKKKSCTFTLTGAAAVTANVQ